MPSQCMRRVEWNGYFLKVKVKPMVSLDILHVTRTVT